jgi:hypothetical protein
MNYYFDDEEEEIWTTGRLIEQPTFWATTAHYWVIIGLVILGLLLLSGYLPHPTVVLK